MYFNQYAKKYLILVPRNLSHANQKLEETGYCTKYEVSTNKKVYPIGKKKIRKEKNLYFFGLD